MSKATVFHFKGDDSMRVFIHSHELSDPAMRMEWERIVRLGLTRFATQIERVSISIRDENGPRGGNDQRCVVRVHPTHLRDIVVQETSDCIEKSLSLGVERAARTLARLHRRRNSPITIPRSDW